MIDQPPVKRPAVARTRARRSAVPLAIGLTMLGTGVFAKLVTARDARAEAASALPPLQYAQTSAPPVAPVTPAAPPAAPFVVTATPVPVPGTTVTRTIVPGLPAPPPPATTRGATGRASPTLIIDLAQTRDAAAGQANLQATGQTEGSSPGASTLPTGTIADPTGDAINAAGAAGAGGVAAIGGARPSASAGLPGNEGFAARVGGAEVEVATAQRLTNLDSLVPQGAIIGAVLETALNSDLPGYARAIVTRDVLSFDGSQVLIPAGSRVIGQYNSGVAQGASRIFIVWSRLIRADGVSIALASPATDDLGRAGLRGKVNRHFLQRFGGAILLSVLTGGIQAAAASVANGNTVVVNSASEATSLAGQAGRGTDIPPTITTKQGATVRIFVARDLDFSTVGPSTR